VLLAVLPHAVVDAAVTPLESTLTLSLIVNEVTLVLLAVLPPQNSIAVHLVLLPLSLVGLAVGPLILALALDFVSNKVTGID
jgi:hypothetical protein